MGTWTLESTKSSFSPLNTTTNFGHNFKVTFRMKYTPKLGSKFTEPPQLDWHERVMMKQPNAGTWWEFETNMYTHKPNSGTVWIWMRRYLEAYQRAAGLGPSEERIKGSSQLLAKDGKPVPLATLGAGLATREAKVKAVRDYLKNSGGILDIEIHDIPSLTLPLKDGDIKERVLIFNCGLVGVSSNRVRGEQLLIANQTQPKDTWTQSLKVGGAGHEWSTRGLRKVDAPSGVKTPIPPTDIKDVDYF